MGLGTANAGIDPGIDPGTGVDQTFPASSPSPTITSISPASAIAGGPDFLLTILGTYFTSDTTVIFGADGPITPVIQGTTKLLVPILAADIASTGSITVTVQNSGGSVETTFAATAIAALLTPLTASFAGSGVYVQGGDIPDLLVTPSDGNGAVPIGTIQSATFSMARVSNGQVFIESGAMTVDTIRGALVYEWGGVGLALPAGSYKWQVTAMRADGTPIFAGASYIVIERAV